MDVATAAAAAWARAIDPATDAAWLARVAAAGARYGSGPVCVHRTPLFVSAGELRRWQVRLARFHRIIRKVRAALLASLPEGDDGLAAAIGIPAQARAWAAIDPGYVSAAPLARLDTWSVNGVPRFIELNAEAPAGMGYAAILARLFDAEPSAAAVREGVPLRTIDPVIPLAATLDAMWRERATRLGISHAPRAAAIVDFAGGGTWPELVALASRLTTKRRPCLVVDPRELTFDGAELRAGDVPIDLVFRRVLVKDLRERPEAGAALLAAYTAGRVCMVNPLRTALLHNKGVFALLRDPRVELTGADRRFVERHVPRSVVLRGAPTDPDSVRRDRDAAREAALRDREAWVLKPLEEHGGAGVVLGWRTPAAEWRAAIEAADHHLLQARIPCPRGHFHDARDGVVHERSAGIDPFLARGRLAGFLCRLAEGELGNVTAGGATQTLVYVAG